MNASNNISAQTQNRKADRIRIYLEEDVQSHQITNGLERYRYWQHHLVSVKALWQFTTHRIN